VSSFTAALGRLPPDKPDAQPHQFLNESTGSSVDNQSAVMFHVARGRHSYHYPIGRRRVRLRRLLKHQSSSNELLASRFARAPVRHFTGGVSGQAGSTLDVGPHHPLQALPGSPAAGRGDVNP
jgi:hypothetical protein